MTRGEDETLTRQEMSHLEAWDLVMQAAREGCAEPVIDQQMEDVADETDARQGDKTPGEGDHKAEGLADTGDETIDLEGDKNIDQCDEVAEQGDTVGREGEKTSTQQFNKIEDPQLTKATKILRRIIMNSARRYNNIAEPDEITQRAFLSIYTTMRDKPNEDQARTNVKAFLERRVHWIALRMNAKQSRHNLRHTGIDDSHGASSIDPGSLQGDIVDHDEFAEVESDEKSEALQALRFYGQAISGFATLGRAFKVHVDGYKGPEDQNKIFQNLLLVATRQTTINEIIFEEVDERIDYSTDRARSKTIRARYDKRHQYFRDRLIEILEDRQLFHQDEADEAIRFIDERLIFRKRKRRGRKCE